MTKIFSPVNINEKENTKSKTETKLEGLKRRYKNRPSIDYVLQIEKLWERYALELDTAKKEQRLETLLKQLSHSIKWRAKEAGKQWNNSRLSAADSESIFFEEAWKLCDNYNHFGEFYFYETLLLVIKRRGIDLTRNRTRTQQGAFELKVRRLKEEAADYIPDTQTDVEGSSVNSLLVAQILAVPTLTEQERKLLRTKYDNPDLSKVELSSALGLKHHQEVTRLFKRLKIKLAAFDNKN
ncbi:hypothetical protein [Mesobacillus selenatarsenatis]|uniref:Uncharacterized protein n=1 Tax=Mesobacillus selenatarsenatis (strain DSM 18680 / JCM 14380 / FERM P-15431 / SF-1) TaxID=1321606 RepID=A0A0A8WWS2_MESS1|nr:hypothetical protein [Mesobacillus selenatarsenatis]GAM12110.1 hypothetical protein SAMD00020551_0229 [Mesobacillus selenatarsenatis SF-1]